MQAQAATRSHAPSISWTAIRFGLIGLSGTAISFALFTLLNQHFGWRVIIANPIAYGAGILNNFFWNRVWNYRHHQHNGLLHQGSQFALVSLGGMLLHTVALGVATRAGVSAHTNFILYVLVYGGATALSYAWNFTMNHRMTFRDQAPATLHAIAHPHLPHPHLPHLRHEPDLPAGEEPVRVAVASEGD